MSRLPVSDPCVWPFSEECLGLGPIQEVYYCNTDQQVPYREEVSARNCDNASHNLYVWHDHCNWPSPSSTLKQAPTYEQIDDSYCYEDATYSKKQCAHFRNECSNCQRPKSDRNRRYAYNDSKYRYYCNTQGSFLKWISFRIKSPFG